MLNVGARLAICDCCDTSKHSVGCRTFRVSKCRWKWKGRGKKKLSSGSSYAAVHLSFLRSAIVCLGVPQCASFRLNFFFHLLSAQTNTSRKKKKKIEKMLRLPAMEQPHKRIKTCREETVSVSFFSRAVTGCCHFPCKGVHYGQSVLSHSPQKRQCCVEACCEMTRSSLSLTEAGKTSKHPPNPIRRRRISTCKVTGTALSKVFQDSAKDGLPKKKKNNWCSEELIITSVGFRISGFTNF